MHSDIWLTSFEEKSNKKLFNSEVRLNEKPSLEKDPMFIYIYALLSDKYLLMF